MKKFGTKKMLFAFFLLVPVTVLAAPMFALAAPTYSYRLFSENTEAILGLFLCILSIITSVIAFKVAPLYKGGILSKTWNKLAIVSVLFALYQILLSLEQFNVIEFGGLDELFGIAIIVMLFITFYQTKKDLYKQMGK